MAYDPSKDPLAARVASASSPARRAQSITPNDSADLSTYAKALYVGGEGDVAVVPIEAPDDTPVVFASHPVGYLPVQVRRVMATSTTATSIVALFD